MGVTLSVELLTPDEFWTDDEDDVVLLVVGCCCCDDGSVSIGVDVSDR